ncbi:MAG: DUF4243 domain-containing protein [Chloroflexi bacterium]|nr:DUF4243 domain-containing protein [Chloroflexota bacterium]
MAGEYDEALSRYRQTGPFYGVFGDGPGFANHGPMVAEVLDSWGRGGDIRSWTDGYIRLLKPRPPGKAPIAPSAWREGLGDWQRAGDWLAFFERELATQDWRDVVRSWLPRLLPGPDMLGHGPIRLFHVLRGLGVMITAERVAELGDALAYWAAAYDRDFAGPSSAMEVGPYDQLILEGAWAYIARPDSRPIVLTHAVTVPRAIRELRTWLSPENGRQALGVATCLSRQIRQPYQALRPELAAVRPGRDELIERAIASGDDHAIKLTEACLSQYERQPEPVYLAVADDVSRRLRADWL